MRAIRSAVVERVEVAALELMQSQKNALFEQVVSAGFAPDQFAWVSQPYERGSSTYYPTLLHKLSKFYYLFAVHGEMSHEGKFSPGDNVLVDTNPVGPWNQQLESVRIWLRNLRRELDAPDLWSLASEPLSVLEAAANDVENSAFTPRELAVIEAEFTKIVESLQQQPDITPPQFEAIQGAATYAMDSARRLGRIDWKNAVAGALVGQAVGAALPAEVVRNVFWAVAEIIVKLLGSFPQLPMP